MVCKGNKAYNKSWYFYVKYPPEEKMQACSKRVLIATREKTLNVEVVFSVLIVFSILSIMRFILRLLHFM